MTDRQHTLATTAADMPASALSRKRAVARVQEVDLPLHVVVLWGVLDDESC